jgi:hypothetical protein
MRRYAPAFYDGRVVVLRAEERPAGPPDLGWKQTLPRLEVGTVTGGHLSCITRHVDAFAARLEEIPATRRRARMNTIALDGASLTLDDMDAVARGDARVSLRGRAGRS